MVEGHFHSVPLREENIQDCGEEEAHVLCTKGMSSRVRHLSQPLSFPLQDKAGLVGSLHIGKGQAGANQCQTL